MCLAVIPTRNYRSRTLRAEHPWDSQRVGNRSYGRWCYGFSGSKQPRKRPQAKSSPAQSRPVRDLGASSWPPSSFFDGPRCGHSLLGSIHLVQPHVALEKAGGLHPWTAPGPLSGSSHTWHSCPVSPAPRPKGPAEPHDLGTAPS